MPALKSVRCYANDEKCWILCRRTSAEHPPLSVSVSGTLGISINLLLKHCSKLFGINWNCLIDCLRERERWFECLVEESAGRTSLGGWTRKLADTVREHSKNQCYFNCDFHLIAPIYFFVSKLCLPIFQRQIALYSPVYWSVVAIVLFLFIGHMLTMTKTHTNTKTWTMTKCRPNPIFSKKQGVQRF